MPAPNGAPRYVVDVDISARRVTVGPPTMLDVDRLVGENPIWVAPAIGAQWTPVHAQVRAHGAAIAARARLADDHLELELQTPIRGLATGQAVVVYDGSRVLGSATVASTARVPA